MRLRDYTPCGHWQTHTIIAELRVDRLTALAAFDGPLDNPTFSPTSSRCASRRYVRAMSSSSITSRIHKQAEIQAPIERVGARLRVLPPYSPDFNGIEQAFAKLKAFLRAARPCSFDQDVELVVIALKLFLPSECRNSSALRLPSFYGAMTNALTLEFDDRLGEECAKFHQTRHAPHHHSPAGESA